MFVGVEISSADDRKSISKGFRSGRSFRYVKSTDDEKEASPSQSNSTWRQQQQHTPRGDLLILKPAISPSPPKFPISPASAPFALSHPDSHDRSSHIPARPIQTYSIRNVDVKQQLLADPVILLGAVSQDLDGARKHPS